MIETPVLIVGGGPIGLALAADLGRRGVPTAAGREERQHDRPRQDARGERPHHGAVPDAWRGRRGAQLGLSVRLPVRQRIRDRHAGLRDRASLGALARRAALLRIQSRARHDVPADMVRSDPAEARAVVSARHHPPPRQAGALRPGRGWRHRNAHRSNQRSGRTRPRAISHRVRRLRQHGARRARHRGARRAPHRLVDERLSAHSGFLLVSRQETRDPLRLYRAAKAPGRSSR